jgi:hypothetical protein
MISIEARASPGDPDVPTVIAAGCADSDHSSRRPKSRLFGLSKRPGDDQDRCGPGGLAAQRKIVV